MARVKGALNKRDNTGLKIVVGVGTAKTKPNAKVIPKKPKAQSGVSSTQGTKNKGKMPKFSKMM
jgi:hypothetical protein